MIQLFNDSSIFFFFNIKELYSYVKTWTKLRICVQGSAIEWKQLKRKLHINTFLHVEVHTYTKVIEPIFFF